jgi:hypothetical protein
MSKAGMVGMELAAREILSVCETLDEDQWRLPSAASGWSVQDVVVHEACLLGDLIAAVSPMLATLLTRLPASSD